MYIQRVGTAKVFARQRHSYEEALHSGNVIFNKLIPGGSWLRVAVVGEFNHHNVFVRAKEPLNGLDQFCVFQSTLKPSII